MSNSSQRYLRFLIPGLLGYFGLYFVCLPICLCSIEWPQKIDEVLKLTTVFVLALGYHMFPFRDWSNCFRCFKVDQDIMSQINFKVGNEISGIRDIKWEQFRDVYYSIIDNDESLKVRSENVRFNGTLWSSAADLRAISAIVLVILVSLAFAQKLGVYTNTNFDELTDLMLVVFTVFVASFFVSYHLTQRQRKLAVDQCDFIVLHKKEDLKKGVANLQASDDGT